MRINGTKCRRFQGLRSKITCRTINGMCSLCFRGNLRVQWTVAKFQDLPLWASKIHLRWGSNSIKMIKYSKLAILSSFPETLNSAENTQTPFQPKLAFKREDSQNLRESSPTSREGQPRQSSFLRNISNEVPTSRTVSSKYPFTRRLPSFCLSFRSK